MTDFETERIMDGFRRIKENIRERGTGLSAKNPPLRQQARAGGRVCVLGHPRYGRGHITGQDLAGDRAIGIV